MKSLCKDHSWHLSLDFIMHYLCGYLINTCLWGQSLFCLFIVFPNLAQFLAYSRSWVSTYWMNRWMNGWISVWFSYCCQRFLIIRSVWLRHFASHAFLWLYIAYWIFFSWYIRHFIIFPQCINPVRLQVHPTYYPPSTHFCPSLGRSSWFSLLCSCFP